MFIIQISKFKYCSFSAETENTPSLLFVIHTLLFGFHTLLFGF